MSDGICWYCNTCKTTKSIRESSFFAKLWWARQYPVSDGKDKAEIAEHAAIEMYQWLHEIYSTRLLQDPYIVLCGLSVIVELDESLFRHKPKQIRGGYHLCSITVEGPPYTKCGSSG